MRSAVICLLVLSTSTGGCKNPVNAPAEHKPGTTIEVEAEGVSGLIFTAEGMGELSGWTGGARWTPSVEEALRADAIAGRCLEKEAPEVHARYGEYTRQYVGYVADGRKLVFINYFIGRNRFGYWKEKLVRVKDGGSSFVEVRVDLGSGTCQSVFVHGEA
jgi:hypothetical protein